MDTLELASICDCLGLRPEALAPGELAQHIADLRSDLLRTHREACNRWDEGFKAGFAAGQGHQQTAVLEAKELPAAGYYWWRPTKKQPWTPKRVVRNTRSGRLCVTVRDEIKGFRLTPAHGQFVCLTTPQQLLPK